MNIIMCTLLKNSIFMLKFNWLVVVIFSMSDRILSEY